MKVYIIIESDFNGIDYFESVVDVYKEESYADLICKELNANSCVNTDYFVKEYLVMEV